MSINIIIWLTVIVTVKGFLLQDDTKTVSTPVGDIIGIIEDVSINSTFSFKVQRYTGIPYAEATNGSLRFKKPVPKAAFKTPFDARKNSNRFVCYQLLSPDYHTKAPLSEDCLRLNIYVPGDGSGPHANPRPVMIWIHGGGFVIGSSYDIDPSVLSTYGDVIVVSINYRLAQYGFLSTGDSYLPGNLGLWDQHLAIKWVHDNIQAFGGDVNRITIFGESAGSASVVYQTFFPGNKGLFHRAIAESGSTRSNWAYQSLDKIRALTRQFAHEAGCNQTITSEYVQCLSSIPISVLNETVTKTPVFPTPVIDNDFVMDAPANILSGTTNATEAIDMFESVDFMIGYNSADGLVDVAYWLYFTNTTDIDNITVPKDLFEHTLVPYYSKLFYDLPNITESVRLEAAHHYTDWSDPADNIKRLRKLTDLVTDTAFSVPAVKTANLHTSSNRSTYIYEFFAKPLKRGPALHVPHELDGPDVANHVDELSYVFATGIKEESENTSLAMQYKTTQATMTFWTNFAKSGNPNLPVDPIQFTNTVWPKYTDGQKYLEISLDMGPQSVKSRVRPATFNLWDVLLPELLKTGQNC